MRKEKLRAAFCSVTVCFSKPFKRTIDQFFYFPCSLAARLFLFEIRMMQEISKEETGKDIKLGMTN